MAGFNPIALVGTQVNKQGEITDGVTLIAPSEYQYDWEDISKANAGRTQDITMNKNRMGRVIALSLGWEKISIKDCSDILNIFNNEYVYVKYTSKAALGNLLGDNLIKSIKEFQKRTGLEPDGNIGPKTLNMLEKYGFKY